MSTILFVVGPLILLRIIEVLKRREYISINLSRRLSHMGSGIINIAASIFLPYTILIMINVFFVVLFVTARKSGFFSAIQTANRKTYGDVYFPLGVILAAVVLLPENVTAFQYGVAIMGFSDALAGFVGERWGQKKIPIFNNTKTVIGALTFYVSSLIITIIFAPQILPALFIVPLILTATEFFLVYGLDNLALPIVAGLLFSLFL